MARDSKESIQSMGIDIPLAVLSERHQSLFNCFKQQFAQVTNPPIDAIREETVTDTHVFVGSDGNLLTEQASNCNVLEIDNPILTSVDLMKIKAIKRPGFKVETLSLLYYKNTSLEKALDRLFLAADRAYRQGANILILSDRGVDENHVAIPSLLAVSAMEQYLIRTKKRTAVSIILESAEPREVHHFACLLGYGARAINPYLAQECIEELVDKQILDKDPHTAVDDYNSAVLHGVVKISSKAERTQVASGRFGVTSEYLVSAKEIQIKMAQGAKPGEGGHLPGNKVYPWIARTRYSTPGVSLISPPPHHDIYSIEDLAQLIYDLKNANKDARISVKLVSESGVGTIAAGVAKAGAQVVLISGYDGGTGAAAQSSIHHAGMPWELGLAEAHQTLIENGLRQQVILEADGKLMSGLDVAIAALLGAEEFGFATAPLITMGCVMMRVCNLDTCPAGVATQNPELRKRFCGKPEYVMNFMLFIAEELREIMASLGISRVDDLVGRTDLLKVRDNVITDRAASLDLHGVLHDFREVPREMKHFNPSEKYDFRLEETVDEKVLIPELAKAMDKGEKAQVTVNIHSVNRTLGTILGSEITKKFGNSLEDDTYTINAVGGGGQSLGAFIPKGLTMRVSGDSNDCFGKGLSGGKLVITPPEGSTFTARDNVIIGNVALYGATSGQAYINGKAGERFCVRNSGAAAVVEGVGNHGCEYMTGGRVAILGPVGKNFAAGMSGGIAYVLDTDHTLYLNLNKEFVSMNQVSEKEDILELRALIEGHVKETGSPFGREILDSFDEYLPYFVKVMPNDYSKMLTAISRFEEKGLSHEDAEMEAFYAMGKE